MNKIKIKANNILNLIESIFNDSDVNDIITDINAPDRWKGKTITEALNITYFAFKHRPKPTGELIKELIEKGEIAVDTLKALKRSFCALELENAQRLYSKDVDMITIPATLEYWIQSEKIQLLEDLIENCNIGLSGIRVPVQFGSESRQAVVIFSSVSVGEVQEATSAGEMIACTVGVAVLLYPDVVSYSDYEVNFKFTGLDDEQKDITIPVANLSWSNTMAQKSAPNFLNPADTKNTNLSRATVFALSFEGYNNDFVNYITNKSLSAEDDDNNQVFLMTISRKDEVYTHSVVISEHEVFVNADTSNEMHTLTLIRGGLNNVT